MENKRLTGYPSIDKPWNKYYRQNPIRKIQPMQTAYNLVFKNNKSNMTDVAIEYLGIQWTFEELKTFVDIAADSFSKMGIKKNDVVLIGVSNSPEAVVVFLALNKLGAISKWFDVRAGQKDIEHYANSSNCICAVIFDMLLPKIEPILNNTKLKNVIILTSTASLPKMKQKLFTLKQKATKTYNPIPKDSRYITYCDFLKNGDVNSKIVSVDFDIMKPSIMVQSSGTTGKPKTIVHSDYSISSITHKISYSDLPFGRGKRVLVALPPWIAYGIGNAIILPLALGSTAVLSPTFASKTLADYAGKYTLAFAAPHNYRYLMNNRLSKKQLNGLRCVECMISGGDKMTIEENRDFENRFNTVLVNGYGNNECFGALTVNPAEHNKYGTVGIPKYGDIVIAFDEDTNKELPYGEVGEICALTETAFIEYENNETETKRVKQLHNNNQEWIHSGDLGFIDEEGFVHLIGRKTRVIIRLGFKIAAYTIEDKICEIDLVKECVAVPVIDTIDEHVPMVFITLNENITEDIESVKNIIIEESKKRLKENEFPKYFKIVDSLPYTANGKYDFKLLEKIGNEEIKQH